MPKPSDKRDRLKLSKDETIELSQKAYQLSGCRTHPEFIALFGGAISLRTFRGWLVGDTPPAPISALVLREFVAGWRPTCL